MSALVGGTFPPLGIGAISPVASADVADGGQATLVRHLPFKPGASEALYQASVRVDEDIGDSIAGAVGTEAGPLWAELWFAYEGGGLAVLLDKGFIRGGSGVGQHACVGLLGEMPYAASGTLYAHVLNDAIGDGSTTIAARLDAQTGPRGGSSAYRPLSTDHWGWWIYQATVTNDGTNSGNHTYEVILGEGDVLRNPIGQLFNGDASTRTADAIIYDTSGGNVSLWLANHSLAAGIYGCFPAAENVRDQVQPGAYYEVHGPSTLRLQVYSVATSQDSAVSVMGLVQGRKPQVTITSPTNATETVNTNLIR